MSHEISLTSAALVAARRWNLTERPGACVRSLKCERHVSALQMVNDATLATTSMDGKVR
jgi:hypothetical protein